MRSSSALINASRSSRLMPLADGDALTDEERAGSALSSVRHGGRDWIRRPQMKASARQEYGKLSYAGAGGYTQINAIPALCTTLGKRPPAQSPRSKN
jgi:hypothetical protein